MTATVVADNPPSAPTAQPQVDHIVEVRNLSKKLKGMFLRLEWILLSISVTQDFNLFCYELDALAATLWSSMGLPPI